MSRESITDEYALPLWDWKQSRRILVVESNPKNGNGSGRSEKAQKPKINGDPTALVTFTGRR